MPVNTALPTVTGTAQVGQTLTGTVGSWNGASSYSQQWQRCTGATCNPISNATASTYVPAAADVGFTLRLQVTASKHGWPEPARQLGPDSCRCRRRRRRAVTDSFTRADALTLGTGWSTTNAVRRSSCLLAISANQAAYPAGKSGGCDQYWTADNLADAVGSFTVTALPPEGGEIDVEGPDPKRRHQPSDPLRRRLAPPHNRPRHLLHRPPRQQRQLGHGRHDQRPRHRSRRPTRLQTHRLKPQPPPQTRRHQQLDANPRRHRHRDHRPRPPRTRALQRHRRQSRRLDNQPRPPRQQRRRPRQHCPADGHGYGSGRANPDRHGRLLERRQQL